MIDIDKFGNKAAKAACGSPFWHTVVDDFLPSDVANSVASEFPDYNDPVWYSYKNKLEDKKALNDWNRYPTATYRLLTFLNSPDFIAATGRLINTQLSADQGLHGGGWHIHANGGKLNPHLDYSIHPKLGLQRKLNLIIYLGQPWQEEWGGHFGLWEHNADTKRPGRLSKEVPIKFNRAVLFDTTQNSWHGLSREVAAPESNCRKSLAIYYMCQPPAGVDARGRALFAPTESQAGDSEVEKLIELRSGVTTSHQVYQSGK